MMRLGSRPAHSSMCQSFQARTSASAKSASSASCWMRWPQKPGKNEGKQMEAYTPSKSMSARRAEMSHEPRRIWSKRVGSKLYSSTGRPTTALNPTFGRCWPSKSQVSEPSSSSITLGALLAQRLAIWSVNVQGGSTMWSSTEMIGRCRSARGGSGSSVNLPPSAVVKPESAASSSMEIAMS